MTNNRIFESIFDSDGKVKKAVEIVVEEGQELKPYEHQGESILSIKFNGTPKDGKIPEGWCQDCFGKIALWLFPRKSAGDNNDVPTPGIVSIGERAFEGLEIVQLNIPTTVRLIGEDAFKDTKTREIFLWGNDPDVFFEKTSTLNSGLEEKASIEVKSRLGNQKGWNSYGNEIIGGKNRSEFGLRTGHWKDF